MYSLIFYGIVISIIFSLYVRINPNYLDWIKNFSLKSKTVLVEPELNEKIDTPPEKEYSAQERLQRWDKYYQEGFLELAINEYNSSLLSDRKAETYQKIAQIHLEMGALDDAEKNLLLAVSIENNTDYILDLVRVKIKQFKFKSAYDLLWRIKENSDKKRYLVFILELLNADFDASKNKLISTLPLISDLNIKTKLVVIKEAFDEYAVYKDSVKIHLQLLIAKALTRWFEFEISEKIIKDIFEVRGDYRDAWIISWYNNLRLWRLQFALDNLQKAYELDPTKAETQFYLWLVYDDMWKVYETKDYYEKALVNNYKPKSQVVQRLAQLAQKTWDYKLAVDSYKEMLTLNDKTVENFQLPIDILINHLHDYELANNFASWAVKVHPNEAFAYALQWYTLYYLWKLDEAKSIIVKSIWMDPKIPNNYYYAGLISKQEWNSQLALKQFEMAYKNDVHWDVWRKAIKEYNELLKNDVPN